MRRQNPYLLRCWPFLLTGLFSFHPIIGQAQAPNSTKVVVRGEGSCRTCKIVATEETRIGERGGILVEWPQTMWQDGKGRIFVMQPNKPELPQVFSRTGSLIRVLGRNGEGPGEYRNAGTVFGDDNDTVFVFDWGLSRVSVIGPQLDLVRTIPFPSSASSAVALRDGRIVANAIMMDPQTVGLAFQLFDRRGYRYAATGSRGMTYAPSTQHLFVYRLAAARGGGFWAAPFYGRYEIERWFHRDSVRVLVREPKPWFVEAPRNLPRTRNVDTPDQPLSYIYGIWEDKEGMVWVICRVADRRGPGEQEVVKTREGSFSLPKNSDRAFDTMVEVIDPRSATVVLSQRFDALFSLSLGNGKVAHVDEQPDGQLVVRVMSLRLQR